MDDTNANNNNHEPEAPSTPLRRKDTPPKPNNTHHRVINIPSTPSSHDSPSNISELSSHNSRYNNSRHHHRTTSSGSNAKKPLNPRQQAAMNTFLSAKTPEDKSRAWNDLVSSLKNHNSSNNSVDSRGKRKKSSHRNIGSSGSVGSSGSNHSLGFIQFHPRPNNNGNGGSSYNGGGMSVTSGLTWNSGNNTDIAAYLTNAAANNGQLRREYEYESGNGGGSPPDNVARPPLFPKVGGEGVVEELVSPLSAVEYYEEEDKLDGGGDEEGGLLGVEDGEEDLKVFLDVDEDEEEVVDLSLMKNRASTEDEAVIGLEGVPPPPLETTTMPNLPPPPPSSSSQREMNGRKSVKDMIGRLEQVGGSGDGEDETKSWSPTMIRRKGDQLFARREDTRSPMLVRQPQKQRGGRAEIESSHKLEEKMEEEEVLQDQEQIVVDTVKEQVDTIEIGRPDWAVQDLIDSSKSNSPIASATSTATSPTTIERNNIVITPQKETPTQLRTRKSKKKRGGISGGNVIKSSSLEDQIRLVLGTNDGSNQDGGDNDAKTTKETSSVTSASDILRELNDSKDQLTPKQPLRSSPNVINRLPPTSISFGTKDNLAWQGENKPLQRRRSKQSSAVTNNGKPKKTPALLKPSRRDLHSLRIRQMVSESTIAGSKANSGGAQLKNTSTATSTSATTSRTTFANINTTTTSTRESPPNRSSKGFFTRTGPSSSPPSSKVPSSEMITKDETTFELYPTLHSNYSNHFNNNRSHPTTTSTQYQQALYTSPPRTGTITPTATTPISPASSHSESINELKASISELKNAGVGGVGKSTSTLVWDESTGKYVIRDLDDESFHDLLSLGPSSVDDEQEGGLNEMPYPMKRGSIRDDDVVDEAVRLAAMDGMSVSSTSVDESLSHAQPSPSDQDEEDEEEEEEDDFFVVERSASRVVENKWRGFNDVFQLNAWSNNNNTGDDGFGDGFADDASFPSEVQWGATDWTDWEDGLPKFEKMNFVSPTSVSSSIRQDAFNPFAQIVLESLD